MFSHSVGLEHGASKPLLKIIFQGVLRLFSPRKTTLMFVIRDSNSVRTPLEVLERILREDIQKIWDSIPMPEGHKTTPLSTFFNVEVVGLPSYLESDERFTKQVYNLRQRFVHSTAPGGLAGDRWDTIPGSGFSVSTQEIWKIIKEDRDLDIPSVMVMVAIVRCGEIAKTKLAAFDANEERYQLEEDAEANPAPGFGKKYSSIIKSCLHEYDMETAYFDKAVRSEKRKHLEETLMQFVQSTFPSTFAHIRSRTLKEFKVALKIAIKTGQEVEVASRDCTEACLKSFDDKIADVIVEEANCDPSKEREKLRDEMNDHTEKVRADESIKATFKKAGKFGLKLLGWIIIPLAGIVGAASTRK